MPSPGVLATARTNAACERCFGADISSKPCHGYTGDPTRAEFRQVRIEQLAAEGQSADVVVLSDVLHRVPVDSRNAFLSDSTHLVRPDGLPIMKEWERRRNVSHGLAHFSDRYLSSDRHVSFHSADEPRTSLAATLTGFALEVECSVRPRNENVMLILRAELGGADPDDLQQILGR